MRSLSYLDIRWRSLGCIVTLSGHNMTVSEGFVHYPDIIWRGLGESGHYPGIRRPAMVSGGI